MRRGIHKLTVRRVESLTKEGWHGDGGGLYLRIREDGSKRWIYVWKRGTKRNEMFLGTADDFRLDEIRAMAAAARLTVKQGFDPRELRKQATLLMEEAGSPRSMPLPSPEPATVITAVAVEPVASKAPLFGKFAEEYIASQEDGWKNEKHRWQWYNSITNHCAALVDMPVDQITVEDVLAVLKPKWLEIQDTAARVRARIERILGAAKAAGHIASPWENPARWDDNLEHKLPKQKKRRKSHYPAINYEDLPAFYKRVNERPALAARALELTILCATRTSETLEMRWREVDFERATWTVPAERMKMGVEHRIPLSTQAITLLEDLGNGTKRKPNDFVFPGQNAGQGRSQMAMLMVLRRMDMGHITVHGMRSAFRDYMGDMTPHAENIIEQALAHQVGDSTTRAYRRKDAFDKRRLVMQDWADYVVGKPAAATTSDAEAPEAAIAA